jgi:hypothetical protein
MLDFTKYAPQAHPSREDFRTKFYYRQGKVVAKETKAAGVHPPYDPDAFVDLKDLVSCVTESCFDELALRGARDAVHAENARRRKLFEQDLLEDLRITGHSKAPTLLALAEEFASEHHDGSFETTYDFAEKLVQLLSFEVA